MFFIKLPTGRVIAHSRPPALAANKPGMGKVTFEMSINEYALLFHDGLTIEVRHDFGEVKTYIPELSTCTSINESITYQAVIYVPVKLPPWQPPQDGGFVKMPKTLGQRMQAIANQKNQVNQQ